MTTKLDVKWNSVRVFLDEWDSQLNANIRAKEEEEATRLEQERKAIEEELERQRKIEEEKIEEERAYQEMLRQKAEEARAMESRRERSVSKNVIKEKENETTDIPVLFYLPGGLTKTILVNPLEQVSVVKTHICKAAEINEAGKYLIRPNNWRAGEDLPDEGTLFGKIPYVRHCITTTTGPKFILCTASGIQDIKEKVLSKEIEALLGKSQSWSSEENEASTAAYELQKFVQEEVTQVKSESFYTFDINRSKVSCPEAKLLLRIYFEATASYKTTSCMTSDTPRKVIESILANNGMAAQLKNPEKKDPAAYVLKTINRDDFFYGEFPIGTYTYVKECRSREENICFRIMEVDSVRKAPCVDETVLSELQPPASIPTSISTFSVTSPDWENAAFFSAQDLKQTFRFRVVGCDKVMLSPCLQFLQQLQKTPDSSIETVSVYLAGRLFHGAHPLSDMMITPMVPLETISLSTVDANLLTPAMHSQSKDLSHGKAEKQEQISPAAAALINTEFAGLRWNEWLEAVKDAPDGKSKVPVEIGSLPREAKLSLTLYAQNGKEDAVPLAWVNCQLINFKYQLKSGTFSLNMWPDDVANPIGTCQLNMEMEKSPATLFIYLPEFACPVVFPPVEMQKPNNFDLMPWDQMRIPREDSHIQKLDKVLSEDPLYSLSAEEKRLIWDYRHFCKMKPFALPKFLQSVPWTNHDNVKEAYRLLQAWAPLSPLNALELLDAKYADAHVRAYAVSRLELFDDSELSDYLLQLVQVVKYEPYHNSSLVRFLLRRALRCRSGLGRILFYHLKSELHNPVISMRYRLILEAYFRGCGAHREELVKEDKLMKLFVSTSAAVKKIPKDDRRAHIKAEMSRLILPSGGVHLPLDVGMHVKSLIPEKCKSMDSKKVPLWLVFENNDPDGDPITVIFKNGDDLRQDLLTLQLLRVMDKMWQAEGLDLEMLPYGCVATGDELGFIEVVLNSDTISNIQKNFGGATAAFNKEPLKDWLEKENKGKDWKPIVDRFVRSTAGYCVATFVLGIGDRHNDNIMLTKRGNLFHIDFGHFLGNFKKKYGMKRERAPFVLTPDIAYVMGGKGADDFNRFIDLSCRAYNILRKNANVFINLFAMMLSTGIPELKEESDIDYLKDKLNMQMTEKEAEKEFTELIYQCLGTKTTQVNNFIHNVAH